MPIDKHNAEPGERDLGFTRIINARREKLWRCWTEPELLKQWFTPKPWTTIHADLDVRPGGESFIIMRSPEGEEFPNPGVYLEVVPNQKIVFTDAFVNAWEPSGKAFMTGILTFEDAGPDKTKYTALVRHWTADDRQQHENMGFHEGWGKATDQLEALAQQIA